MAEVFHLILRDKPLCGEGGALRVYYRDVFKTLPADLVCEKCAKALAREK